MKKTSKGWALGFFGAVGVLLLLLCGKTLLLDPYFHYHKPLPGVAVPGLDSRYQNDGILRNFDYDTIITGSSMADALFGVHSVKVALFGSTYHEIYLQTQTALKRTPNLKMVFQCLDYNGLIRDPQELRYDASWYPQYLYDNNPFNDVYYLMNKTMSCSRLWRENPPSAWTNTAGGQTGTPWAVTRLTRPIHGPANQPPPTRLRTRTGRLFRKIWS